MAIHPGVALGFRPPQLAPLEIQSPLDRYQKMLTLRHLMQQGQLGQMNIEQTGLENEALREKQRRITAVADLFKNGRPPEDQMLAVGGPEAAAAIKALHDADQAKFTVLESTTKAIARAAQGVKAVTPDKRDFAYRAARSQLAAINPALAAQMPEQYPGDSWLDQKTAESLSAEQYLTNVRADAKFALEQPELAAKSLGAQMAFAAQTAPNNQSDWDVWRAGLSPGLQQRIPAMFSPVARDQVRTMGLTREQQAAGERAAGTAAETGRHNLQMEKRQAAIEDRQAAQAKETARHNRAMEGRISQATAAGLTQAQSQRVLQIAGQFDNEPMVKNYNTIAEANNFARSLGEKGAGNAGDDQALLYAFAKAMDPGSVVREGEYATVQKYAQSWAQNFGFKAERIFSNSPFLSDDARKQMKDTIGKKASSAKTSYDNIYNEYGRRIERQSGVSSGKDFLTNYGQAFEGSTGPAAPAGASDAVKSLLGNSKPGTYTLSDGTRWTKKADGTVIQAGQ